MTPDQQRVLLSPLFILGLCLLLINDFYLKKAVHNTFTGKLSDFAGLFVFSLFLGAFLPRARGWSLVAVAFLFCFWKSVYFQNSIDSWNEWIPFHISRTVDVTD